MHYNFRKGGYRGEIVTFVSTIAFNSFEGLHKIARNDKNTPFHCDFYEFIINTCNKNQHFISLFFRKKAPDV